MRSVIVILLLSFISFSYVFAQTHGFPFGQFSYRELEMKTYAPDTAATAVVLDEFGEAHIDDIKFVLVFRYHAKIKILKQAGIAYADFSIPMYKGDKSKEFVVSVNATTFNMENGSVRETKFDPQNLFTENKSKYYDIKKFALPNVRVGSVIEVEYVLESPFIRNFRSWEFQSDYPKIHSEYWAVIPANYQYNISLRGFFKLSKNEHGVIRDCFSVAGAGKADCNEYKYAMSDIPAFKEEDYMTAKSNFLAALNFELAEIKYFDGRVDKLTREWKDAEEELRKDSKFGIQLKRGKDIVDQHIEQQIAGETDPLIKAQKIYEFIKGWYRWDKVYGEYSEFGIKKAFDNKIGNVGDINLSLIAALKYAGLDAQPILLSTRANGLLTELYPVLSEFNYVIAKLNIQEKVYLLDATEDLLSFGLIPERCLNGKGRVLGDKESYWFELKAPEREKNVSVQTLVLGDDGILRGTIQNTYFGYEAMNQRTKFHSYGGEKEFVAHLSKTAPGLEIKGYRFENVDDLAKPMSLHLDIEMEAHSGKVSNFLLNPFILGRWEGNPFKSSERLYPVDFGAPLEEIVVLNLTYPASFEMVDAPERVALALPDAGGRYVFDVKQRDNTILINSALLINKTVFTSHEYHFLKELFGRYIAVQQADLLFKTRN